MAKRYVLGRNAATWIRQAMGNAEVSMPGAENFSAFASRKPAPFTVRYSRAQNSGAGALVVYYPDGALSIGGVKFSGDISNSAAVGFPDGWYVVRGSVPEDGSVFAWIGDMDMGGRALEFTTESSTPSMGEFYREIATCKFDEDAGVATIEQFVVGALNVPALTPFEIVGGRICNRVYRIGGKTYIVDDFVTAPTFPTDGILALVVGMGGTQPSPSFVIYANYTALYAAEADLTKFVSPLYEFKAGVPYDLRQAVQMPMGEF